MISMQLGQNDVALIAAVISLVSLMLGIFNWRQTRHAFMASTEARIEDLYDRLMDYRLKHPEVFRLSRRWTPECLTKIYRQCDEEDRSWAIYIGYVELCISYCNAALVGRKRGRLSKEIYRSQYEPLMKLLITEHFSVIQQLTREGGFVSSGLSEFIKEQRRQGWNWELEYQNMDKVR